MRRDFAGFGFDHHRLQPPAIVSQMPTTADTEAAPPPAYFASQPEPPSTTRYEDGLDHEGNVWGQGAFDEPTSETSPLLGSASPRRRQRLTLNLNRRNTLAFLTILGILALTIFNVVHLESYSSLQHSIVASRRQLGDIRTEVASVELRRVEETSAFKVEQAERSNQREKETQQWDAERHERKEQMEKENKEWTATRRQRQEQNEREDRRRALDHQRENERWEAERRHRQARRQQETEEWERERQHRAEEDERDEASKRDAEKRAEMHLWWDSPQYAPHCAAWGAREYTAKLNNVADGYDPIRACEHTPVVVHENVVNKPNWCETRDGVWGHWTVHFKEKWCEPWWNTFEDKGCIGRNTGLRQFDAKLEGVAKGEDHYLLCTTAPASIGGTHFDKPMHCFDHDWAMWGVWEIKDDTC